VVKVGTAETRYLSTFTVMMTTISIVTIVRFDVQVHRCVQRKLPGEPDDLHLLLRFERR